LDIFQRVVLGIRAVGSFKYFLYFPLGTFSCRELELHGIALAAVELVDGGLEDILEALN
jgi:hypothetical protein